MTTATVRCPSCKKPLLECLTGCTTPVNAPPADEHAECCTPGRLYALVIEVKSDRIRAIGTAISIDKKTGEPMPMLVFCKKQVPDLLNGAKALARAKGRLPGTSIRVAEFKMTHLLEEL